MKKGEYQQIWEDVWYVVPGSYYHQCCNPECLMVHNVDFKIENGRVFYRFKVNAKETAKARRKAKVTLAQHRRR